MEELIQAYTAACIRYGEAANQEQQHALQHTEALAAGNAALAIYQADESAEMHAWYVQAAWWRGRALWHRQHMEPPQPGIGICEGCGIVAQTARHHMGQWYCQGCWPKDF